MASRRVALFSVCVLWWASGRKAPVTASVKPMVMFIRYAASGETSLGRLRARGSQVREGHITFSRLGHGSVQGQRTLKLL